jgi:hypothetical protein
MSRNHFFIKLSVAQLVELEKFIIIFLFINRRGIEVAPNVPPKRDPDVFGTFGAFSGSPDVRRDGSAVKFNVLLHSAK